MFLAFPWMHHQQLLSPQLCTNLPCELVHVTLQPLLQSWHPPSSPQRPKLRLLISTVVHEYPCELVPLTLQLQTNTHTPLSPSIKTTSKSPPFPLQQGSAPSRRSAHTHSPSHTTHTLPSLLEPGLSPKLPEAPPKQTVWMPTMDSKTLDLHPVT